jgi:hypothetical protein
MKPLELIKSIVKSYEEVYFWDKVNPNEICSFELIVSGIF